MSAGSGVRHSEMNPSATEPLHLCQIWVMPAVKGLQPPYEEAHFDRGQRQNLLLPVVTPEGGNGERLEGGDQARVTDERDLKLEGLEQAELILIDLP